jgi:trehalose 6-phosphate synthase
MPAKEQRARMRLMRGVVQEFNVYRWAGRMLIDAAAMRRRGRLLDATIENMSGRAAVVQRAGRGA